MIQKLLTFIFLSILIASGAGVQAQNTGFGTATPTHTVHIKPSSTNPNQDPLRLENLQSSLTPLENKVLVVNKTTGVVKVVDIDSLIFRMSNLDSLIVASSYNIFTQDGTIITERTINLAGNDIIWANGDVNLGRKSKKGGKLAISDNFGAFNGLRMTNEVPGGDTTGFSVTPGYDSTTLKANFVTFDIDGEDSAEAFVFNANLKIDEGYRLGVGTDDPKAPVHISGGANLNAGAYVNDSDGSGQEAFGHFGSHSTNYTTAFSSSGNTDDYSLIAEEGIAATEFHAYSDVRIKKDIVQIDQIDALDRIKKLHVTDYQYIDRQQHGVERKTGFLAQEVAEIYPQAINRRKGVLPDIYAVPREWKYEDGMLHVSMEQAHQLKPGSQVRMISDKGSQIMKVESVSGNHEFQVTWSNPDTRSLFVYGTMVNDFLALDYDEIFSLNVAATQELADKVEKLEDQLDMLMKRIEALEKADKE